MLRKEAIEWDKARASLRKQFTVKYMITDDRSPPRTIGLFEVAADAAIAAAALARTYVTVGIYGPEHSDDDTQKLHIVARRDADGTMRLFTAGFRNEELDVRAIEKRLFRWGMNMRRRKR